MSRRRLVYLSLIFFLSDLGLSIAAIAICMPRYKKKRSKGLFFSFSYSGRVYLFLVCCLLTELTLSRPFFEFFSVFFFFCVIDFYSGRCAIRRRETPVIIITIFSSSSSSFSTRRYWKRKRKKKKTVLGAVCLSHVLL